MAVCLHANKNENMPYFDEITTVQCRDVAMLPIHARPRMVSRLGEEMPSLPLDNVRDWPGSGWGVVFVFSPCVHMLRFLGSFFSTHSLAHGHVAQDLADLHKISLALHHSTFSDLPPKRKNSCLLGYLRHFQHKT